jgi:phosphopantetheinyl transferase
MGFRWLLDGQLARSSAQRRQSRQVQKTILLHAGLSPAVQPRWAEALLQALPYARRLHLERANDAARTASLGGLALALAGALKINASAPRVSGLLLAADQKPRFASGPHFSISHSVDRVACAVCAATDIGLDIESELVAAQRPGKYGPRQWTAIEATLKAAGRGLRQLADVRLDPHRDGADLAGVHYVLHPLQLTPRTFGHVAAPEPLALEIVETTLDGGDVSAAVERSLGLLPEQ